jgi:hypothetical protein
MYGRLIVGGVLGVDVAWLLERAPKEVDVSTLLWSFLTATGHRAWAAQVGQATSMGLITPSMLRP